MQSSQPADNPSLIKYTPSRSQAEVRQAPGPVARENLPEIWLDLPNPGRGPTGPLPPITSGFYGVGATMMDSRQFKLVLYPA